MYEEQLVYAHMADLRREAAAYRRVASRADRARPRRMDRAAAWVRTGLLHRPAVAAGCQA